MVQLKERNSIIPPIFGFEINNKFLFKISPADGERALTDFTSKLFCKAVKFSKPFIFLSLDKKCSDLTFIVPSFLN